MFAFFVKAFSAFVFVLSSTARFVRKWVNKYRRIKDLLFMKLDAGFTSRFSRYSTFATTYSAIRPYLATYFFIIFVVPGLILILYLFFLTWRYFDIETNKTADIFIYVNGIRVESLINLLYVIYRYAETSGFYFADVTALFVRPICTTFFSDPKLFAIYNWEFVGVSFKDVADYVSGLIDHIRRTPIPSAPRFPIIDAAIYNLTGIERFYHQPTPYPRVLSLLWYEYFTTYFIAFCNIPHYIWVDRTELLFYQDFKFRMEQSLLLPAWGYFKYMYVYEAEFYIRDWLAFIPNFGITETVPYYFVVVFLKVTKAFYSTALSMKYITVYIAQLTDLISLYSGPMSLAYSFISLIYGVPFFLFSFVFIHLVLFFFSLRIFVVEAILTVLDTIYIGIWPFFTTIEYFFSPNRIVREYAYATALWELTDLWMIFIPLNFILIFVYCLILVFSLIWFFTYRPLFLLYCLLYDYRTGVKRPSSEVKEILKDQVELLKLVVIWKWCLFCFYFSLIRPLLMVPLIPIIEPVVRFLNWTRLVSIKRFLVEESPVDEQFREDWKLWLKEMNDEEKQWRRLEDGLMDKEEEAAFFASLEAIIAHRNIIYKELSNWSRYGTIPDDFIKLIGVNLLTIARVIRFFGTPWGVVGLIGIFGSKELFIWLFMDGVSPNSIIAGVTSDAAHYQQAETVANLGKIEKSLSYDRYVMRWLPEYGGQWFYRPAEIPASSPTYGEMIITAYRYAYIGFSIIFTLVGFTWLAFRTFRLLVTHYWSIATVTFLVVTTALFGEAYDLNIVDHLIPGTGFLYHWLLAVDGWVLQVPITDCYEELKLITMERQMLVNRIGQYINEKPAWGWWRYRGLIIYGVYYYRLKFIAVWAAKAFNIKTPTEFKIDAFEAFLDKYHRGYYFSFTPRFQDARDNFVKSVYLKVLEKYNHFFGKKEPVKPKGKNPPGRGGDDGGDIGGE